MRIHIFATFALIAFLALTPETALAYVGPGAGLSAIGSVLAFLGVIFLMIVGFFWYPAKRLIARFRKPPDADKTKPGEPS